MVRRSLPARAGLLRRTALACGGIRRAGEHLSRSEWLRDWIPAGWPESRSRSRPLASVGRLLPLLIPRSKVRSLASPETERSLAVAAFTWTLRQPVWGNRLGNSCPGRLLACAFREHKRTSSDGRRLSSSRPLTPGSAGNRAPTLTRRRVRWRSIAGGLAVGAVPVIVGILVGLIAFGGCATGKWY
jgi:hypothetical protein